jgi:hypothetical protein
MSSQPAPQLGPRRAGIRPVQPAVTGAPSQSQPAGSVRRCSFRALGSTSTVFDRKGDEQTYRSLVVGDLDPPAKCLDAVCKTDQTQDRELVAEDFRDALVGPAIAGASLTPSPTGSTCGPAAFRGVCPG